MDKKSLYNVQNYIPYILALTLAVIGIVRSNQSPIIEIEHLLFQMIFFTLMLLSIWFINLKTIVFKWSLIVLINITLIGIYSVITHIVFSEPNQTIFFSILRVLIPTILILGILSIVISQKKNERLIIENFQLKTENYKAELDSLRKQLNPHFLFNSLTTLQTIIRKDVVTAEEYVIKLSDLYRNILTNSSASSAKLKDELAFAKTYLFLQKKRFKSSLNVEINVKRDCLFYSLPTFSLQLLIENCIKHNIVSDEKPLHISISQSDSTSITVSNNRQPKILKKKSTGTGLLNLYRRYELMGIADGLTIKESDTEFSVALKFF